MAVIDRRKKDRVWNVADENGVTHSQLRDGVTVAVLMDIRDELKRLNDLLHCQNFIGMPATRCSIRRKLPTPERVKP